MRNRDENGIHFGVIPLNVIAVEALAGLYEQGESLTETYESDYELIRYESQGYIIEADQLGIWVLKSPFTTRCDLCSPCAPGAGDLTSHNPDGVPTYCLGIEWFDKQAPMPYE